MNPKRPIKYVSYSRKDISKWQIYPSLMLQNSACKDHYLDFLRDKDYIDGELGLVFWDMAHTLQRILLNCPTDPPFETINSLKHQLVDFGEDLDYIDFNKLQQIISLNPPEDALKMAMIVEQTKLKVVKKMKSVHSEFIAALRLGHW